jgi:hypothetical protein
LGPIETSDVGFGEFIFDVAYSWKVLISYLFNPQLTNGLLSRLKFGQVEILAKPNIFRLTAS